MPCVNGGNLRSLLDRSSSQWSDLVFDICTVHVCTFGPLGASLKRDHDVACSNGSLSTYVEGNPPPHIDSSIEPS